MKLHATNNDLLIKESERLISGSVKIYTCEFTFDESWDGYTVTAVFSTGNRLVNMAIVDGKCEIPYEVLRANARVRIGVFGVDGDRRRPTTYSEWIPVEQGVDVTGGNAQPPAPSVYEQWMNSFSDAAEHAEAAQDAADAARNSEYMAHAYAYGLSALEWDDFEAHVSAKTGATAMTKKDHRICVGAEYILEVNGEETVVYGRRDGTETVDGISNAKISAMGVDVLCIYLDGEYDRLRFVNSNDYDVLVSYKAVHIDGIIGAKESAEQAAESASSAASSESNASKSESNASTSENQAAIDRMKAEYAAKVAHYGQVAGASASSYRSSPTTETIPFSNPLEIGRVYRVRTAQFQYGAAVEQEIIYTNRSFAYHNDFGSYGSISKDIRCGAGVTISYLSDTELTVKFESGGVEFNFWPVDDSVFDSGAENARIATDCATSAESSATNAENSALFASESMRVAEEIAENLAVAYARTGRLSLIVMSGWDAGSLAVTTEHGYVGNWGIEFDAHGRPVKFTSGDDNFVTTVEW